MKRISRVISLIAGAISSFFVVGCDRPSGKIYGPPEMLEEYQRTGKIKHSGTEGADGDVAKPENEAKAEMPESEEPPTAIYGPPEMFGLEPQDVPDVNSAPEVFETAPVYGVPDAPPQPEANDAPKDAPDKAKADDASDRDANDKDLKMLNAAEETIEPLATVYGPVNKLDPPRPEVVFMPSPELKNAPETAPNKAKADNAADRNVSDKDLKLLKEAERTNLIYTLYGCE